jgi:arylamine N-acetyltransferase
LTIPVDEILEDLEVSRAEPGPGFLERLFLRFNDRVPFETATKILRQAAVADPAARPRNPEIFWEERLASGAGGTCFARVAAFDALLSELGFSTRRALGRVRDDFDHAALLVSLAEGDWICDVGFPLPALLPPGTERAETGVGALVVRPSARGIRIVFDGGVPEGPREVEIFSAAVSDDEFETRWRATFRPDSNFLSQVLLHRQIESRKISFARGEVRIDDLHSRTRIPISGPRPAVLEELFGMDAELLVAAFAIAGDGEPESPHAKVEVFLEAPGPADAAYAAVASAPAYARLHEGVAGHVVTTPAGPRAWDVRLAAPAAAPGSAAAETAAVAERVSADDAGRSVRVERGGSISTWDVEERHGRAWLIRRLTLAGPRLDLLRNDSMRGRIAGTLALDLLAWARRIGAEG